MRFRMLAWSVVVVLVTAIAVTPASGYIHFPPTTLQKMCKLSTAIRVLTVKKYDNEKRVIVFAAAETLKGKTPDGTLFKHVIGKADTGTKPIFDWVADGKQAVMVTIEWDKYACGYVFIDNFCYSVDRNVTGEFWLQFRVDPELAATFYGTVETLQKVTKDLLAGKDVKVPVNESVKHLSSEERRKRFPAVNETLNKNREK